MSEELAREILEARLSGEAPLKRTQVNALEEAYRAKGGNDFSLLKLMGSDGDRFFQEEMDTLGHRRI